MKWSSGQIIAFCRLVLASVFLLAIYIDPSQPAIMPATGYVVLGAYAAIAVILVIIAFASFWLDFILARFVHVLDLVTFGAVVYMTEGYTSPFFTFSVFLLLSAAIRWSARETTLTAIAVNTLFLGAGAMAQLTVPLDLDLKRLLIRAFYLMVLSGLFVLFAVNAERPRRARGLRAGRGSAEGHASLVEAALDHVQSRLSAGRIAMAWRDTDEPRSWISWRKADGVSDQSMRASDIDWAIAFQKGVPHLFEVASRHRLWGGPRPVIGKLAETQADELAKLGLTRGIALPVRIEGLEATVFAAGIHKLSSDHLAISEVLIDDLTQLAEDDARRRIADETTEARVRINLARDLHDSVAQFLAGVSFRLEALRRSDRSAEELREDIERFQDELASEQMHLRELITELRRSRAGSAAADLSGGLSSLCQRLADQWQITVDCQCDQDLVLPAAMEGELRQMIREAVANAVRHGRAERVEIGIARNDGAVRVTIADNGSGIANADTAAAALPRSLEERTRAMGGDMSVSGEAGTRIELTLPLGAAA